MFNHLKFQITNIVAKIRSKLSTSINMIRKEEDKHDSDLVLEKGTPANFKKGVLNTEQKCRMLLDVVKNAKHFNREEVSFLVKEVCVNKKKAMKIGKKIYKYMNLGKKSVFGSNNEEIDVNNMIKNKLAENEIAEIASKSKESLKMLDRDRNKSGLSNNVKYGAQDDIENEMASISDKIKNKKDVNNKNIFLDDYKTDTFANNEVNENADVELINKTMKPSIIHETSNKNYIMEKKEKSKNQNSNILINTTNRFLKNVNQDHDIEKSNFSIDEQALTIEEYKEKYMQDDHSQNHKKALVRDFIKLKEKKESETEANITQGIGAETPNKISKKNEKFHKIKNAKRAKKRSKKRLTKESNKNQRKNIEKCQDSDSFHSCIGTEPDYPKYFYENEVIPKNIPEKFQNCANFPTKEEMERFKMLRSKKKTSEFSCYSDLPDYVKENYYSADNLRKIQNFLDKKRIEEDKLKSQEKQYLVAARNSAFFNDRKSNKNISESNGTLDKKAISIHNNPEINRLYSDSGNFNIYNIKNKDSDTKSKIKRKNDSQYIENEVINTKNDSFIYTDDNKYVNTNLRENSFNHDIIKNNFIVDKTSVRENNSKLYGGNKVIQNNKGNNKVRKNSDMHLSKKRCNLNDYKDRSDINKILPENRSIIMSKHEKKICYCDNSNCENCKSTLKLNDIQKNGLVGLDLLGLNRSEISTEGGNQIGKNAIINHGADLRKPGNFSEIRIVPQITESNSTEKSLLMETYYNQKLFWLKKAEEIKQKIRLEEIKSNAKEALEIKMFESVLEEARKTSIKTDIIKKKIEKIWVFDNIDNTEKIELHKNKSEIDINFKNFFELSRSNESTIIETYEDDSDEHRI